MLFNYIKNILYKLLIIYFIFYIYKLFQYSVKQSNAESNSKSAISNDLIILTIYYHSYVLYY